MKWHSTNFFRHLLLGLSIIVLGTLQSPSPAAAAASDTFPHKPIQLSIVFTPGSALDGMTRVLAKEAESLLNQTIIPQNNPGGGGMPGVARLAKSAPDGYSLGTCLSNALIFIPHRNTAPYRPLADVEPIIAFGQGAPLLVVAPNSPWKDMETFLEATRAKKGSMRIGIPGLGTPSHIALVMMSRKDPSLSWRFVPFAGPGEAEAALLGGHVDAAASGAVPRIKTGQLHPLLMLAGERAAALPDVPCLTEKGFDDPGQGDSVFLLLAPAGTPDAVLDILEKAFLKAASSEAFLHAMESYSVAPNLKNRAETKAFLAEAWKTESTVLAAAGLAEHAATQPK